MWAIIEEESAYTSLLGWFCSNATTNMCIYTYVLNGKYAQVVIIWGWWILRLTVEIWFCLLHWFDIDRYQQKLRGSTNWKQAGWRSWSWKGGQNWRTYATKPIFNLIKVLLLINPVQWLTLVSHLILDSLNALFIWTFNAQKWIQSPFEGLVDPCELLANIEAQINNVKDEALSRKEIMDRIERWLSACDEENWLEDYNRVSKI